VFDDCRSARLSPECPGKQLMETFGSRHGRNKETNFIGKPAHAHSPFARAPRGGQCEPAAPSRIGAGALA